MPSAVAPRSEKRNPERLAFQHGRPPQVPAAGATARKTSDCVPPESSKTHRPTSLVPGGSPRSDGAVAAPAVHRHRTRSLPVPGASRISRRLPDGFSESRQSVLGAGTQPAPGSQASHSAQVAGVPVHVPPLQASPAVHAFPSLQIVPGGNGAQVDGVPVQAKHGSTWQVASQPSPATVLPSSHASPGSSVPPPQRDPCSGPVSAKHCRRTFSKLEVNVPEYVVPSVTAASVSSGKQRMPRLGWRRSMAPDERSSVPTKPGCAPGTLRKTSTPARCTTSTFDSTGPTKLLTARRSQRPVMSMQAGSGVPPPHAPALQVVPAVQS